MAHEGAKVPPPDPALPWSGAVAVTAAILATLAAISGMFSERHRTESMIDQIQASDQWSYYQAKGIKLALVENKNSSAAEDLAKAERYKTEQTEIKAAADAKQTSATDHRHRASVLSHAATAAQISIALAAISLLTKRRVFWVISLVGGVTALYFLVRGIFPLH